MVLASHIRLPQNTRLDSRGVRPRRDFGWLDCLNDLDRALLRGISVRRVLDEGQHPPYLLSSSWQGRTAPLPAATSQSDTTDPAASCAKHAAMDVLPVPPLPLMMTISSGRRRAGLRTLHRGAAAVHRRVSHDHAERRHDLGAGGSARGPRAARDRSSWPRPSSQRARRRPTSSSCTMLAARSRRRSRPSRPRSTARTAWTTCPKPRPRSRCTTGSATTSCRSVWPRRT